ncbi:MAG: ABC transporter ATP-binding protein [Chloroflexi bacterium]|nr:ABC transporter ATP-binding protein [Chloroflexota bacterium]
MTRVAVRCADLTKGFGQVVAVQGIDLDVEVGSFLALLGPSGCGKTTLLRLIAGFEVPDSGAVEIGGRPVVGPGLFVPPEKRRVGIIFQDYALFPHLTVAENIAYGIPRGAERETRVQQLLALTGLAGLGSRMPHELSGGQQQRVALARSLAPNPQLLLLDEPFSNLDPGLRAQVRAEVKEILTVAGATAIFVTHDQEEAMLLGDRVAVMNQGRLEQVDTPERVFHRPASPFVATFVGVADLLPARASGEVLATEVGLLPLAGDLPAGTEVTVLVRPDDVAIQPDPEGPGEVVEEDFQGSHYLYTVRLPSGTTLRSLQPHTRRLRPGTPVAVALDPGHDLPCFFQGRPVARAGGRDGENPLPGQGKSAGATGWRPSSQGPQASPNH